MNILFLANELRYTCGVTNHLIHLGRGLGQNGKNRVLIITGGGNGTDRFRDTDVKVLEDGKFMHGNRNAVNYLSAANVLAKFVKRNKIDIIHSHSHYAANIAALASKLIHVARVQTNHGLLEEVGKLKHFAADRYVAINEHIYDYIIKNDIARPPEVKFIRCGIPVPRKPALKKNKPIKVLAASRFTAEKGLDTYINAVSKIPGEVRSRAEFYIAGEGEEEGNLVALNNRLKSGVRFLGRVTDLPGRLKENHIFIYPSRSKREGFPAVITEAGAYNNLLITSDFEGAYSVLKNGADCLVFPAEDPDMLAVQITRAINGFGKLSQVSEALYVKVKELFDLGKMISKHEELYRECLKA